jgi:SAM-dependent methyltransferase
MSLQRWRQSAESTLMSLGVRHSSEAAEASIESPRPDVHRRQDYLPVHNVEEFIVRFLRSWIEPTLAKALPLDGQSRRVIDVGCGRQPFRQLIESRGAIYTSIDAVQNREKTVDFIAPLDGQLPEKLQAGNGFDVVLCTEVLEHVADWHAAFTNLAALTASTGRVIVTCPHFYPRHEEPYDFWRATPHALRWYAQKFGFEVEQIECGGNVWDVLGTIFGSHYVLPANRGLTSRLTCRIMNLLFKNMFRLLKSGWLQARCEPFSTALPSPYQANVAVFRKP